MKKSKVLKRIGIVALSSALAIGSLTAMTGCGGGGGGNKATELWVHIFCGTSDRAVNQEIMDNWAKKYSADHPELGFEVKVNFTSNDNKDTYFKDDIDGKTSSGRANLPDVMYLAPKYVKRYSRLKYVMDLSPYLSADDYTALGKVWQNAVSYYGYDGTEEYTLGQPIHYDASKNGFVTDASGSSVKLYGLPKDYSNFSLGFNRQYFTADLVKAFQTSYASTARNVNNAATENKVFRNGVTPVASYKGGGSSKIATFAASGTYYIYDENGVPDLEHPQTAVKGEEAPLLAIGVPVTYKPFNFYLYNDYDEAIEKGDPVANLVRGLTRRPRQEEGFTVTMPGLPGWTFKITDADGYSDTTSTAYKAAVNENASYDGTIGHTVLTYQEYGALSWLMTYYLNTFAWDQENTLQGWGGKTAQESSGTVHYNIFGGEQYEYYQGCSMYLLPWLAASDADITNQNATTAVNNDAPKNLTQLKAHESEKATTYAGTDTEDRQKLNLDGSYRTAKVQYGINSQNFLKVYAAYANHGAVWNANAGGANNGQSDDGNTGWNYFQQGRSIFYGAGSWDASTRNDTDPSLFDFGQMPTPVAEEYALYSETSNADYDAATMVSYRNANNIKGVGDEALKDNAQTTGAPTEAFAPATIYRNQILRQDKWAARMDSVGYAANGRLADLAGTEDPENWKAAAAASLIAALTISEEDQLSLTYSGAQFPNFVKQCNDFLKYQETDLQTTGAFKDMLTPDGFADNTAYIKGEYTAENVGRAIWNHYMAIAVEMGDASHSSSQTVGEWLASKTDFGGGAIKYNHDYENTRLSEFKSATGKNYATAMKVLNMVNFTYADRDLNIRMQTGLNAVRDSTMYTPDVRWLDGVNAAADKGIMLTYSPIMSLTETADLLNALRGGTDDAIGRTWAKANQSAAGHSQWMSPAMYAMFKSISCEAALQDFIRDYNK